jgi:hypothetical protein
MVEFDDSDQLNDGQLEPISPQELTQKKPFKTRARAVKDFIDTFIDADIIDRVVRDPQVKVDKRQFLQQQFADAPCLDEILLHGPQSIYELEILKQKAREMVHRDVEEIFVAGATPQRLEFWNHAVRMIQQILYMFGEDELPNDAKDLAAEIKKYANNYWYVISALVKGQQVKRRGRQAKQALLLSMGKTARKNSTRTLSVKSSVNKYIKEFILETGGFRLIDELMDAKRGGAEPGISGEHR